LVISVSATKLFIRFNVGWIVSYALLQGWNTLSFFFEELSEELVVTVFIAIFPGGAFLHLAPARLTTRRFDAMAQAR
jgi:hypothetical protein